MSEKNAVADALAALERVADLLSSQHPVHADEVEAVHTLVAEQDERLNALRTAREAAEAARAEAEEAAAHNAKSLAWYVESSNQLHARAVAAEAAVARMREEREKVLMLATAWIGDRDGYDAAYGYELRALLEGGA